MPRLFSFLKGRGHRLEFVVGVMKVTNGRKGDAPRRECTAPRPRRGPRGGEALAGVRRRARVRVQGAGRRDDALMDSEAQQMCGASRNERSDGRENSRNGYRPRSLETAVGDVELEIPKLRHGTYYPEGMLARWSRVDTSVAAIVQRRCTCAACHPQGRARGVQTGRIPARRARRSRASAPTSTPRWRSSAAATCRARRAATCG